MDDELHFHSLHKCPLCRQELTWVDGDGYCGNRDCPGDSFHEEDDRE